MLKTHACILFLYLFSTFNINIKAQCGLSIFEERYISNSPVNMPIHLVVRGVRSDIEKALQYVNGRYILGVDKVHSVQVYTHQVLTFIKQIGIEQVDFQIGKVQTLLDTALINARVNAVHQGISPLDKSYQGKGVIIGIIDQGIDFRHEDFKNSDGTTRIRYIWDQGVLSQQSPSPYGYGQEWNGEQINGGVCSHVERDHCTNRLSTHGTQTAGIAAGNGRASNRYTGIAPQTDIIAVNIACSNGFINQSSIVHAVDYVFKKADSLGKPCVINTSIGNYSGSHDGRDMASILIDSLLEAKNGRVLVAAAGNAGHIPFHLGYRVIDKPQFTWLKYVNGAFPGVYLEIFADTVDFKNVSFFLEAEMPTSTAYIKKGKSSLYCIKDVQFDNQVHTYTEDIKSVEGDISGKLTIRTERVDNRYVVQIAIRTDYPKYIWRIATQGSGRFDAWSHPSLTTTSEMIHSPLPSSAIVSDIDAYVLPDFNQTLVSGWQCSDKVITVGNYVNRYHYPDIDSIERSLGEQVGQVAFSSSRGPTRDNRIKPDISASGATIMTTANSSFLRPLLLNGDRIKIGWGGKHLRAGGTSSASPIVAGIVALYLEKHPDASYREVKQALIQSARKDTFTGQVPNNRWGAGKVDAWNTQLFTPIWGCTDSMAFNFSDSANLDDTSCIAVIKGCMDSLASNYDSTANRNEGCIYIGTNTKKPRQNTLKVEVFPSLVHTSTKLFFRQARGKKIHMQIVNLYGVIVHESIYVFSDDVIETEIDMQSLPRGVYICQLMEGRHMVESKKIIKL